jgi:imidazoleglycerol-phosphate dehydratase
MATTTRTAELRRTTKETDICVRLNLDGAGRARVRTGVGFLDHMLELLAKHALLDLDVKARGDLQVDDHHTVEDVGLALGQALDRALGDRSGIRRYGAAWIPMDEALGQAVVDLGGRPFLVFQVATRRRKIKDFDLGLLEDFFRSFTVQGRLNLHLRQAYGDEPHHAYEALFKALARALREAVSRDARVRGVPSSKGVL